MSISSSPLLLDLRELQAGDLISSIASASSHTSSEVLFSMEQPRHLFSIDLGRRRFGEVLKLQRELVELRAEEKIPDLFILVEHEPVITIGKGGGASNIYVGRKELERRGVELFEIERGGNVTFHGPGQLVGYPIINLKERNLGLHEYLRILEEIIIQTCAEFGVAAERSTGKTGVWIKGTPNGELSVGAVREPPASSAGVWVSGTGVSPVKLIPPNAPSGTPPGQDSESLPTTGDPPRPERKIASIGVAVKRWITFHGFAFNVCTDLSYFDLINPCGLGDVTMTSLSRELDRPVSIADIVEPLVHRAERLL